MVNRKLLEFLRSRFPTKQETQYLFAVSLFPSHIFAFLLLFQRVPELILRTNLPELLAVFAYVLSFTLLESLTLTILLVLLASILPYKVFRYRLVSKGTLFILVITIWSISLQAQGREITEWYFGFLLLELFIAFLIATYSKIAKKGINFVERLAVLSYAYLFVDMVSVMYLIVRTILL
jgi:hypothetical protein